MSPPVNGNKGHVRFLPLTYDNNDSRASALKLIYTLMPQWADDEPHVDLVRFTDGITNTLLKAVNRRPGLSKAEIDREAILLRAYGNRTDILIDREREAANHELLMQHGLAPDLLARFENGMLYRFVAGTVAQPADLRDNEILAAVARRLAQWHATVPCLSDSPNGSENGCSNAIPNGHGHGYSSGNTNGNGHCTGKARDNGVQAVAGKPSPNVWTTMQKWIKVLPTETEEKRQRRAKLQEELDHLILQLSQRPGLGLHGLVFAHCDLLSANIIIHRGSEKNQATTVSFIDYEYGTPSPAAFDIANHFAEWAGYECDYSVLPTRAQRKAFVHEYVATYFDLSGENPDLEEEDNKLMQEVDAYRGVPGFYWGIWSLIQAMISDIDFDYASYAEERLGEYWAFKAEEDGSRAATGNEKPLREKRWAQSE